MYDNFQICQPEQECEIIVVFMSYKSTNRYLLPLTFIPHKHIVSIVSVLQVETQKYEFVTYICLAYDKPRYSAARHTIIPLR